MLNAVVAQGGASRDGGREEDRNEVERRLSEGRRAISSRPPTPGILNPMTSRMVQREHHRWARDGGPNGLIMSPAEIIEHEIVRPIFHRVNFKGRKPARTDFPPRLESAPAVLCGDATRTMRRTFKTTRKRRDRKLTPAYLVQILAYSITN